MFRFQKVYLSTRNKKENDFLNMSIYFLFCIQYEQFGIIKREFNLTKVSVDMDMFLAEFNEE